MYLALSVQKATEWGVGGVRSAGGNVGYNMFLIQLMAACATQYDGCGLFWSVSSCIFVFAPDFKDVPFSEPCGAIKARWLTCSDLPKLHLHAPKIPKYLWKTTELTECSICWKTCFFIGTMLEIKKVQACFLYNGSSVIDWLICILFIVVMEGIPLLFKSEFK